MSTLTLKQQNKPMYQIVQPQPQNAHPRTTLRRVLWVKFLRYVDKHQFSTLIKHMRRSLALFGVGVAIFVPQFVLGVLHGFVTHELGMKFIAFMVIAIAVKYYGFVMSLLERREIRGKGNQHCYNGIPVPELADYLMKNRSFKVSAMNDLGLSQPQHRKIAEELEVKKILVRDENNARVLNETVTREILVKQLSEGFPLLFDKRDGKWGTREDSSIFSGYLHQQKKEEEYHDEQLAKLERKKMRLKKTIKNMEEDTLNIHPLFTRRELTV